MNHKARAILHNGDTYFTDADLNAWEIKYCIDNDTDRFAWATSTGKGVIYYMKDEYGNECPYDFKNIQYTSIINDDDNFYYTFSDIDNNNITDKTLTGTCYNNRIMELIDDSTRKNKLSLNIFINNTTDYCFCNTTKHNCYRNIFYSGCYKNELSDNCRSITLNTKCHSNIFMYNCYSITLPENCTNNIFESLVNNFILVVPSSINLNPDDEIRYYKFISGFNYLSTTELREPQEIEVSINNNYQTIVSLNRDGNIKEFCLADLAALLPPETNADIN